jgi:hypothetical protein
VPRAAGADGALQRWNVHTRVAAAPAVRHRYACQAPPATGITHQIAQLKWREKRRGCSSSFHIQYRGSSCHVTDLMASPSSGSIPSPGSASSIPGHTTHSTRIRTYDYPSSAGRRRQPANSVGSSGLTLTPTKMVKSLSLEAANAASSSDLRYVPSTNPVRYFSTFCSPRNRNRNSEWYTLC